MQIKTISSMVLLILPLTHVNAADPLKLDDETARISYSLGYQIGGDFKRQGVEMNEEAVIQGMQDAISGKEPMMSSQEMNATLIELKRKVVAEQRAKRKELELQGIEEDTKFLKENADKPDVITTESGLQYKIISQGSGKSPSPSDQVTVHYRGTLSSGQVFDSSHDRGKPATFQLSQVIKGWSEGLQLIKEGGKIQLVIPPGLAYDRGPLERRTLVFDVELISVDEKKPQEDSDADGAPAG